MLPVTALCAVVLALAHMGLGIVTIGRRRQNRVAIGDGGTEAVARPMRAQANLGEYGIFFLALLGLAELNLAPWPWLALLAVVFVTGRALHAYGLLVAEPGGDAPGRFVWRTAGMATTFTTTSLAAATVLAVLLV
jgi:uncharacterized membrane protein YecN with MAPEG domain